MGALRTFRLHSPFILHFIKPSSSFSSLHNHIRSSSFSSLHNHIRSSSFSSLHKNSIMAGLKVHGSYASTETQAALSVIYEKGLDYEFVKVDMTVGVDEQKKEPYLSLNPFGLVPAFQHGDLTLFESRAITKYLAEEFADKGTQLIAANKAHHFVWTEVEANQFDPVASKIVWELYYKPKFDFTTDEAVVKENVEKLEKVLDIYEARLANSKYLAGDEFSLADLQHQGVLQLFIATPHKALIDARPHVAKWVDDILSRPAWVKVFGMFQH